MESRFGIGLGIGAVFALIGFVSGMISVVRSKPWQSLARKCRGNPSKPTHQNAGSTKTASDCFHDFHVSVILATVFMAIARYL